MKGGNLQGDDYILFLPQHIWISAFYVSFAEPVSFLKKKDGSEAIPELDDTWADPDDLHPLLPEASEDKRIIIVVRAYSFNRVTKTRYQLLACGRDVTDDESMFLKYFNLFQERKWDAFECYLIDKDVLEAALNSP